MPVVRIEMLKGRTREQKQELINVFTAETARIARCAIGDVQVIITEVDVAHWAVGGVLADQPVRDKSMESKSDLADLTVR